MGQVYGNPSAIKGPSAPSLSSLNGGGGEKDKQFPMSQSATRIEVLVRLVICSHCPFIQSRGSEVAIFGPPHLKDTNKYNGSAGSSSGGKHGFLVLFDRFCALTAIEGESVDEIIPDVLEFAYDYKNLALVFDGAFTLKFGRMAQVRPRTVDLEHGMECTVVFHLSGKDKEHHQSRAVANLEGLREDFVKMN